jgi:hypothetical protein
MWVSSDLASSLVYWDNPRESGIAFGSVLVCLLAVRYISLIRDQLYLNYSTYKHDLAYKEHLDSYSLIR